MRNILNFIDQLTVLKQTSFNITCLCPVCGDNDFKISLNPSSYGFFKCWTTGCNTADIWKTFNLVDKRYQFKKEFKPPSPIIFSPVDPPKDIQFVPSNNYSLSIKEKYYDKNRGDCFRTIYNYSEKHRVCRYDYQKLDKEGNTISTKDTIPQTLINGKWINGTFNELWDLYNFDKIMNNYSTYNSIISLEGERCYPGNTEILTKSGWISFDKYNGEEEVLQYNHDKTLNFVKPSRFIKKYYEGKLIHTFNKGLSILTTPDHQMVGIDKNGNHFKHSAELRPTIDTKLPRVGLLNGKGITLSDNEIKLAIAVSADATLNLIDNVPKYTKKANSSPKEKHYRVLFHLKKERKKERLTSLLNACKIEYRVVSRLPEGFHDFICSFPINFPVFRLFPWDWVSEASISQREMILEELIFWDGNNVPNRPQTEYSSKYLENATWVQTLCHSTNRVSTVMTRSNKFGHWFKVSILNTKTYNTWQAMRQLPVRHNDNVYCVTVPSGMLIIRHDSTISICGNCASAFSTIGILALTPRGSGGFTDKNLSYSLLRLKNKNISHVLYIPDNDEPGLKKALSFQQSCYKQGLSCTILEMKEFWSDVPTKGDYADLLSINSNYSKEEFLNIIFKYYDCPSTNRRSPICV